MNIYTRDELAALLGIAPTSFQDVLTRQPSKLGQVFKLNTPVDVGERTKAKYVALVRGGWGLFPTLASARLWILADTNLYAVA